MPSRIPFRTAFNMDLTGWVADVFDTASGRGMNVLTQIAKLTLHEELVKHHQKRIPKHFLYSAKGIYGYKPRTAGTIRRKQRLYGTIIDLVKSGKTRESVKSAKQITVGGHLAGGSAIVGTLSMWFPYSIQADPTQPGAVKIQDMINEIATISPDEADEFVTGFEVRFIRKLQEYAGGRRSFKRPSIY